MASRHSELMYCKKRKEEEKKLTFGVPEQQQAGATWMLQRPENTCLAEAAGRQLNNGKCLPYHR